MSWNPTLEPSCPGVDDVDSIETLIVPRARDIGDFKVRRALPSAKRQMVGPFVFFDQMGPAEFITEQGIDVRPHVTLTNAGHGAQFLVACNAMEETLAWTVPVNVSGRGRLNAVRRQIGGNLLFMSVSEAGFSVSDGRRGIQTATTADQEMCIRACGQSP